MRSRYVLKLLFIQILFYVPYSWRLGFYYDDWSLLWSFHGKHGLDLIKAVYYGTASWHRPIDALIGAGLYAVGGENPHIYHIFMMLMSFATAAVLFLWLNEVTAMIEMSFIASAFIMTYPTCTVTHFWMADMFQPPAQLLIALSFYYFTRWELDIDDFFDHSGRWMSLVFYSLSLLVYDNGYFMPLILVAIYLRQPWASYKAKFLIGKFWPFAAAITSVVAWYFWGVPHLLHHENPKAAILHPSASHAVQVFWSGIGDTIWHVPNFIYMNVTTLLGGEVWVWSLLALGVLYTIVEWDPAIDLAEGYGVTDLKWLGLACLGAAYLPYALSSGYVPTILGPMNRINGLGAWAGGMLLTVLLSYITRRRLAATGVLYLFLIVSWTTNTRWGESWDYQKQVVKITQTILKEVPLNSTVLLYGHQRMIGDAPTFITYWDFPMMVKLKTGREDLITDTINEAWGADDNGLERFAGNQRYQYSPNLFVLNYPLKAAFSMPKRVWY